jgi:cell division transport system permease protein
MFSKGATFMMFFIIGITMCLPTTAFLFLDNVKQASNQIEYKAEISIFLKNKYSKEGFDTFKKFLKDQPLVEKIIFEDKNVAWEKLQTKLKIDGKSLIEKNPLPDSYYLTLSTLDQNEIDFFIKEIKSFKLIQDVLLDSEWVNKLNSIISMTQLIINFLGIMLLSVLAVIIGNTIRLQTLSLKSEIEVSKLIGASNSFVRRPFLYSGFFYGLGGSLITILIIQLILIMFNEYTDKFEELIGFGIVLNDLDLKSYAFLILMCLAIAWFASFWSASRSINKHKNYS